jgi:hypothetical protein
VSAQASVTLVSPGGRCSGGAAAIGIPSSCSPLDNAASSLAINARMRSHSFNTNGEPLDLFVRHAICSLSALPLCWFQELIFHTLLG